MSRRSTTRLTAFTTVSAAALLGLMGCAGGGGDTGSDGVVPGVDTDTDTGVPGQSPFTYGVTSAMTGGDSVAYSGQVFRHVLISELDAHLGGMTARLDGGSWQPAPGEAGEELTFYLDFDSSTSGSVPLQLRTDPAALQGVFDDISGDKDLAGKLAGNDPVGQHQDWGTTLVGVGEAGSVGPDALVRGWFAEIDAQAVAWGAGAVPVGPTGTPVPRVAVTPDGRDLQQLVRTFLQGAVSFSQGTDDYLDDDTEGKGLLSDHTARVDGAVYTELEHQWDEGFGYFGAPRSLDLWSADTLADRGYQDDDADGAIDLLAEHAFGHAVDAGRRDRDAAAPTGWSQVAFGHFLAGRTLLAETAGSALTDAQLAELQAHRDGAVAAWEAALAATVVHHLNGTLRAVGSMGTDAYDRGAHAADWSAAKGTALSLQFNPRSPLADADLLTLHEMLGEAPLPDGAGPEARADRAVVLRDARALLGAVYGLDISNLGDDDGSNGW